MLSIKNRTFLPGCWEKGPRPLRRGLREAPEIIRHAKSDIIASAARAHAIESAPPNVPILPFYLHVFPTFFLICVFSAGGPASVQSHTKNSLVEGTTPVCRLTA